MSSQDLPTDSLQDVRDIRQMMERSSRFLSLSGFSGIAAGVCALTGAYFGKRAIIDAHEQGQTGSNERLYPSMVDYPALQNQLILIAGIVFLAALATAFFFTWRRTRKDGGTLWNITSRKLFWNMVIPIVAGGFFILALINAGYWGIIAPSCLVFYGLALVNAGKYTLTNVRYLGFCEIIIGLISMWWPGYGLWFWALGFGVMHIVYGIAMWYNYERKG